MLGLHGGTASSEDVTILLSSSGHLSCHINQLGIGQIQRRGRVCMLHSGSLSEFLAAVIDADESAAVSICSQEATHQEDGQPKKVATTAV